MHNKWVLVAPIFVLAIISSVGLAQRPLDQSEIQLILKQLTDQPRKTWISAGTIRSEHIRYRAAKLTDDAEIRNTISQRISAYLANPNKPERSAHLQKMRLDAIPFNTRHELANEYTVNSSESVVFDGQRFYWEIDVESRTDRVKPDKSLEHNELTNHFDTALNAKRAFIWNGEQYILYTASAGHAFVDADNRLPRAVNGPLTAGIIPWGHGRYSYGSLSALQAQGLETVIGGKTRVTLTLRDTQGSETVVVLDPAMDYALLSCSISGIGNKILSREYANHQNASGQWIPMGIVQEQHDADSQSLLARDVWTITSIDTATPSRQAFDVNYKEGTLIEYVSPVSARPVVYQHSATVDTEALLAEKLAFDVGTGTLQRNCATAAMKYALGQLDISVSDAQLAGLIPEISGRTNLQSMKQFAENQGLHCRAIKADLDTLSSLDDCQMILYLPAQQHFVNLAGIDADSVRLIDLAGRKFHYRADTNFFPLDWSTGVTLLLSRDAIPGDFVDISVQELADISGADGWTCTDLLQAFNVVNCEYVGGVCSGNYTIYWERWGCESAASGSCTTGSYRRLSTATCIEDPEPDKDCMTDGDWTEYFMNACM